LKFAFGKTLVTTLRKTS